MNNVWIIAQAGSGDTSGEMLSETVTDGTNNESMTLENGSPNPPEPTTKQTKDPGMLQYILPVAIILMVVMMLRAPQKQKKERKKLEQSLEKNDRILTIGGIYGTIVDIKEDEVTLKIDESNNTKIKVTRSAIGRNVSKD